MAKRYTNRQTAAEKSRAAMIGRREGAAARTDAAEGRMTKRSQGAEAARDRMIERGQFRHDNTDEGQRAVADMMNTAASKATKRMIDGEEPDEALIAACLRDIYDEEGQNAGPERPQRSADQARQEMIDRMSGACPDRLPRDYEPTPGNGR